MGIEYDGMGNIIIVGGFQDEVDFNPGPGVDLLTADANGNMDIFVLKLDTAGNFVWAESRGGLDNDQARDVRDRKLEVSSECLWGVVA